MNLPFKTTLCGLKRFALPGPRRIGVEMRRVGRNIQRRYSRINGSVTNDYKRRFCSRVVLNISGDIYETLETTLRRFPNTLLGSESKRRMYFCDTSKQYFFDRSRLFFDAILFFYQSGTTICCSLLLSFPFLFLPPRNLSARLFISYLFSEQFFDEIEGNVMSLKNSIFQILLSKCQEIFKMGKK